MNLDRVGAGLLLIAALRLTALPVAAAAPSPLGASTNQVATTRRGLPDLSPGALAPRAEVKGVPAAAGTASPGLKADATMRFSRVVFEGNTAIPSSELAALAAPLQGQAVTLESLKALAATVSAYYQSRGYLLAQALVPVQTVRPGGPIRRRGGTARSGSRETSTTPAGSSAATSRRR